MSSFQPTGERWRQASTASGPRGGFWQRAAADVIDAVVVLFLSMVLVAITGVSSDLLVFAVICVYCTLLEGDVRGQTLGKRAMRIRVASIEGGYPIGYQRAFLRTLARLLSWIPFGLGYFWMLWSGERQTWHDSLTRAVVLPLQFDPRGPR